MRRIAILLLAMFLLASTSLPAFASHVAVGVEGQRVHLSLDLTLVQNVTTLPSTVTSVDTSTGSNASAAFAQALKSANPSASPSNLQIALDSKQNLNVTCAMDVDGVSQLNGDIVSANMTWLSFIVTSDLRAGNLSFNTVGARYFRPVVAYYANASRFVGRPNSTITGVTFFVNGTSVGSPQAENYAGNFTMLNFSPLVTDVTQWNRTYTVTNNTTTWRFSPGPVLDLDVKIERRNVTTDYVATYEYDATISVPGIGRAQGQTILVGVGTGESEWLMATIVILAVIGAVGVQLSFRNRRKRLARFQRK